MTSIFFVQYILTIIRFRFCDIQNNQGLGNVYQPKPKTEAENPYRELDYSGYHRNLIQWLFVIMIFIATGLNFIISTLALVLANVHRYR